MERNWTVDRARGVHQRLVVQVGSSRHLAEWPISSGGRCRAQGTCVRGHISVRIEWRLTVDRARGVHQRLVVQVGFSRHLAEWPISSGGRCRAQGTCVRGNIYVRMEGRLTVDRA